MLVFSESSTLNLFLCSCEQPRHCAPLLYIPLAVLRCPLKYLGTLVLVVVVIRVAMTAGLVS